MPPAASLRRSYSSRTSRCGEIIRHGSVVFLYPLVGTFLEAGRCGGVVTQTMYVALPRRPRVTITQLLQWGCRTHNGLMPSAVWYSGPYMVHGRK